jgi:hypothetical protein
MPTAEYEHRTDSVLAWKRAQKLGRFDPEAPSIEQQKIRASEREVEERSKLHFIFRTPVYELVCLWRRVVRSKATAIVAEDARVYYIVVLACKLEMLQTVLELDGRISPTPRILRRYHASTSEDSECLIL